MRFCITKDIENDHSFYIEVGRKLGFHEITISELNDDAYNNARLEGMLSGITSDDVVLTQSFSFDNQTKRMLIDKLHSLHAKILLLVHEYNRNDLSLYQKANCIITTDYNDKVFFETNGFSNVFFLEHETLFDIERLYYSLLEKYSELKYFREDVIHVAFGLHDKSGSYSVWVGVTMQTILKHTNSRICFHILHDETLNNDNRKKLLEVCKDTDSFIVFHKIDVHVFQQISKQVQGYTIGSVFRIMIPDVLTNLNKVLYLDADLFVNLDIQKLWDIDLEDYCIGAVKDANILNQTITALPILNNELRHDEYFNSGVLLLNLEAIRKHGNMKEEITEYLVHHTESNLPDQDALNVVYRGSVRFIDAKFNRFIRTIRNENEMKLKECIYHYVGTKCVLSQLNEVDLYYYGELLESPWGFTYSNNTLRQSLYRTTDRIDTYQRMIKTIINQDIVRIFVGKDFVSNHVTKIILKRDTDIQVDDLVDIENILLDLKEKKMESVLFVSINVPDCISILETMGLENQKDFYVMQRFLSNTVGGFI